MTNIEYILRILIKIITIIFFIHSCKKPKETYRALKKSIKKISIIGIIFFSLIFFLKKYEILLPNKHYEIISPLLLIFIFITIYYIIKDIYIIKNKKGLTQKSVQNKKGVDPKVKNKP